MRGLHTMFANDTEEILRAYEIERGRGDQSRTEALRYAHPTMLKHFDKVDKTYLPRA